MEVAFSTDHWTLLRMREPISIVNRNQIGPNFEPHLVYYMITITSDNYHLFYSRLKRQRSIIF